MTPEPLLYALVESLPDAVVLMKVEDDDHFRYECASKYACDRGVFAKGNIGKLVTEAHRGTYGHYLQTHYARAVNAATPVIFKDIARRDDGRLIHEAIVMPVMDRSMTCRYLIAAVLRMEGDPSLRVTATRRILESLCEITDRPILHLRYHDTWLEITDTSLRKAMADDEFFAEYQPLVDPVTGVAKGVEALVRWNHPDVGLIPPMAFVAGADQLGCLVELDLWMMRHACREIRSSSLPDMQLQVNLSPQHLRQRRFIEQVRLVLTETGFPPDQLTLEITENAFVEDVETVLDTMQDLSTIGVKFAVDDFGVGYSSLSYLKYLPVHQLKIDRSFVTSAPTDRTNAAIIRSVGLLGKETGLTVVAEGVESPAQLQCVAAHCDLVQGYLYSRPVRISKLKKSYMLSPVGPSLSAM